MATIQRDFCGTQVRFSGDGWVVADDLAAACGESTTAFTAPVRAAWKHLDITGPQRLVLLNRQGAVDALLAVQSPAQRAIALRLLRWLVPQFSRVLFVRNVPACGAPQWDAYSLPTIVCEPPIEALVDCTPTASAVVPVATVSLRAPQQVGA